MSLVIIGNHYGVCHGLGNHLFELIFDGEDYLKPEFLVLMTTIASDTHGKFDLHGSFGKCWWWISLMPQETVRCILCRLGPLFDLICVEYNNALLFVLLKHFFLVWLLLLLSRSSLSFSLNTSRTDLDLAAVQRFLFIIFGRLGVGRGHRAWL